MSGRRHGDQPGDAPRRRRHEPVPERVLPGPGGGAAGGGLGVYGHLRSGAYPGYPGRLVVDKVTGASYNAHGLAAGVPVAGDVGPGDVRVQDPRVIWPRGLRTEIISSMYGLCISSGRFTVTVVSKLCLDSVAVERVTD
ncbi:uncharacterized protein J3R85_010384 [Psidium guajava]|nr:uncharacterized protein J3R85_010384 [Psidium guajava]